MKPLETIAQFDVYLAKHDLTLEAVVIGGAALALLGVVTRQTRDCDILHPELSVAVSLAARSFAAQVRHGGTPLQDDWLNNGPSSLCALLPAGWQQRLVLVFEGKAVKLHSLGREDLLKTKLFALCDRGIDLGDCIALCPTTRELQDALSWLEIQDGNPDWPTHVRSTLAELAGRLGYVL